MARLTIDEYNKQILSSPLSITEIDTEEQWRQDHMVCGLSKCINLTSLKYLEVNKSCYGLNPNITINLNLINCVKLTRLILQIENQTAYDSINLTGCVNLNYLSLTYCYSNSSLPDLTKCLKLRYFICIISKKYVGIDTSLFPDMIECNGVLIEHKLDKEIESRIKDEESFRLLMDRRFYQLEKQLKDETHTRKQINTEERLNKLEEENRLLKIKDDENKKILQQHESLLSLIESKFNKLEEENKDMRKNIDELRPTKSSFM